MVLIVTDVKYFIFRVQQSDLFHGKFHEWVEDNSTAENTIGFINYLAVDRDSKGTIWAACLGERGCLFEGETE